MAQQFDPDSSLNPVLRSRCGKRTSYPSPGGVPVRLLALMVSVVVAPVLVASTAGTGEAIDDALSTTLLGRLEPGGEPRLAVRWDKGTQRLRWLTA